MGLLSVRELELLAGRLDDILQGSRVRKIQGTPPGSFVLRLRTPGGAEENLFIALEAALPRLSLLPGRVPAPRRPHPLVESLRRELKSGRLQHVQALPGERIVRLDFEVPGEEGPAIRRIYVELLPRSRNLILTTGADRILLAVHTGRKGRGLLPGHTYEPPPSRAPSENGSPVFEALGPGATGPDLPRRLEAHAAPMDEQSALASRAARLRSALSRRLKKDARLLKSLEEDLSRLPDPDALRRQGDVLKCHLGEVGRGLREVTLPGFEPDEKVTIPLDPGLGPRENLEQLYRRARKAERARPRIEDRRNEVRLRMEAAAEVLERIEAAEDEETLERLCSEALRRDLVAARLLEPASQEEGPRRKPQPARRQPYRTFVSADGIEILVGRTAADNDQLTFKIARGNEYWFHVAGYPGSHVVVRTTGDLPQETLLDAATLAAHYSSAPKGGAHEVSWTRRKWVRKFRGAAPGQVLLAQRKSLRIRPDPARLARLAGR